MKALGRSSSRRNSRSEGDGGSAALAAKCEEKEPRRDVTDAWSIEDALGREERVPDISEPLRLLASERILITGARGSIGSALVERLSAAGVAAVATDLDTLDVTCAETVASVIRHHAPTLVIHLGAIKHVDESEDVPNAAVKTNVLGTMHLLSELAERARLVSVSTCKACNPETVYGASKLLTERLTLNVGGTVARLYNVVETAGNVFEIWTALPVEAPVPATRCVRYFISREEAVAVVLWAAVLPSGVYTIDPGTPRSLTDVARSLFPTRAIVEIPPRAADRHAEPRVATNEAIEPVVQGIERIVQIRTALVLRLVDERVDQRATWKTAVH
jgi:FlaA1/EpsC-like NDP-sugar epimerase